MSLENKLPETLNEAIKAFNGLTGIGHKTAFRLVLDLLKKDKGDISFFSNSIQGLNRLSSCKACGFYVDQGEDLCSICINPTRSTAKTLCVVEELGDLMAIEQSGQFDGTYYIMGGVLNPLLGIGPDELNLDKFFTRVKELMPNKIIFAINPSVEGDATCSYIKEELLLNGFLGDIFRIGFGVPIGSNLSYLDPLTIKKALENSQTIQ